MNPIITVNISGEKFLLNHDNFIKSKYLSDLIKDPYYEYKGPIMRSPMVFRHVQAYLIDPKHPYPKKYAYELDFYGIEYNGYNLYDPVKETREIVNKVGSKVSKLNTMLIERSKIFQ